MLIDRTARVEAAASIKRARAAQDPDKKENDDVAPTRQRRPEAA